ncbi:hypothetical protein BSKO_11752 [Bryopsis sp. KO-2023]|nr:hypothetical protein BSKO_11752 [Bryopsis sp. KO-2023]
MRTNQLPPLPYPPQPNPLFPKKKKKKKTTTPLTGCTSFRHPLGRRQLDKAQAIMDALAVRWKKEALVLPNQCKRIVAGRAEIEEALKNEVTELKEELRTIQRGEGDFGKQISSMQRSQADMRSALEVALQRASIGEAVSEQARIREEEHAFSFQHFIFFLLQSLMWKSTRRSWLRSKRPSKKRMLSWSWM